MILDKYERIVLTVVFDCLEDVISDVRRVFFKEDSVEKYTEEEGQYSIEDVYTGTPPSGSAHNKRVLLAEYGEKTTIIVANLEDGWQSLGYITSKNRYSAVLVVELHRIDSTYPANAFTYIEGGKVSRHVSARKEDKWVFHSEGAVLAEEKSLDYKKRKIMDRITPDDLLHLAESFGVFITDDFTSIKRQGILFQQITG